MGREWSSEEPRHDAGDSKRVKDLLSVLTLPEIARTVHPEWPGPPGQVPCTRPARERSCSPSCRPGSPRGRVGAGPLTLEAARPAMTPPPLRSILIGEFLGTLLLVLLGDGVVAEVELLGMQ